MTLENASISLAAVRAVLERDGHTIAAKTLRGIEVNNTSDAQAALEALQQLKADSPDSKAAIAFAMSACHSAGLPNVA